MSYRSRPTSSALLFRLWVCQVQRDFARALETANAISHEPSGLSASTVDPSISPNCAVPQQLRTPAGGICRNLSANVCKCLFARCDPQLGVCRKPVLAPKLLGTLQHANRACAWLPRRLAYRTLCIGRSEESLRAVRVTLRTLGSCRRSLLHVTNTNRRGYANTAYAADLRRMQL